MDIAYILALEAFANAFKERLTNVAARCVLQHL